MAPLLGGRNKERRTTQVKQADRIPDAQASDLGPIAKPLISNSPVTAEKEGRSKNGSRGNISQCDGRVSALKYHAEITPFGRRVLWHPPPGSGKITPDCVCQMGCLSGVGTKRGKYKKMVIYIGC